MAQNKFFHRICWENVPEEPEGLGKPCQALQGAAKGRLIEVSVQKMIRFNKSLWVDLSHNCRSYL